jgi:hypothetical protein
MSSGSKPSRPAITHSRLLELLTYEKETGHWIRKSGPKKGRMAGGFDKAGYRIINVEGRLYRSARLAHFFVVGAWPEGQIDHRNMDKGDDKWENLRLATHAQNNQNKRINSNNSSGSKGVTWNKAAGKWQAQITFEGKARYLGLKDDKRDAEELYASAAKRLYGDFARTNK